MSVGGSIYRSRDGSQLKSVKVDIQVDGNNRKSVKYVIVVCGSRRENMETSGSKWKSVEVVGRL